MNIQPLLQYISRHVELTPEEEQAIIARTTYRRYLKGQYVVQQGDVCRYESFVLSGCLKLFYLDNEGEEHIAMFAIENWWTSDFASFLSQTPADYNVQCLENTEVLQISYESLQLLYTEVPKLERFFRIIIQNAYVASQKRVIRNFTMSAKEKYLRFREEYPQIEQRVPQYMVASYLGITKEFLSRIRSQLITGQ